MLVCRELHTTELGVPGACHKASGLQLGAAEGLGGVPAGWELLGSGPGILAISSYNSIVWALVQSELMLITFRSAQLESFSPATSLVAAHEVRDGKKEMTGLISCNKETLLY